MPCDAPAPPDHTPPAARGWVDALWLATLLAFGATWCFTAAPKIGLTYDEVLYLDIGLSTWRGLQPEKEGQTPGLAHDRAVTNGVMPLPLDVLGFPLYVAERRAGGEKFDADARFARLNAARAMTFGWYALLVVSAWRLGRAVGGPWAGRIASGLLAADPNFLAHSTLATTDISVCATLTAFARAVYVGRGGGWWSRVVLPGLWFGVAVACKLSALLYGGLIIVALEVAHRFATGALARPTGAGLGGWGRAASFATVRSVLATAVTLLIGIALAAAFCGMPDKGERPFVAVANAVPPSEELKEKYMEWAKTERRVPHMVSAFAFQWWWNAKGRPTYLNGTYYPAGYTWYFPELLLMKIPAPVLLLALIALLRPRAVLNPLTFAALLMLAVLLRANLQIGVRLALPVVALGYIALATALARGYPKAAPWIGLPAILAVAVTSVWLWPHALGYINQPHGGLEAAPRRVCDSNLDWGQGLPDLAAWREKNGNPPVTVIYFGADPRYFKRTPDDDRPFDQFPVEGLPIATADDLKRLVGPRVLAIGHTAATLHTDGPPSKVVTLQYLKTRRPLARTATFTLYDFRTAD